MRTMARSVVVVALLCLPRCISASDLEVVIRPHAKRIAFGDPLYVEAAIVNRGKEVVKALPASTYLSTFRFEIRDPRSDLTLWQGGGGGLVGGVSEIEYEPGQSRIHYFQLFLPPMHRSNDPFWDSVRTGRTCLIGGVLRSKARKGIAGVELRSDWQSITVEEPKDDRFFLFEQYANDKSELAEKGPVPADLGLSSRGVFNRNRTAKVANEIAVGEIADLLELTLLLQDLYSQPDDAREVGNTRLLDWLKGQPDIKRQYLSRRVAEIATAYKMQSTAKSLDNFMNQQP